MRRRLTISLIVVAVATGSMLIGGAQSGSASSDHRDLLINRTKTVFEGGPFEGDNVTLYGSGRWNTVNGRIDAEGVLVHRHPDGQLVARAVWKAVGVESFTSYGSSPPLEGGQLVLDVRFFPTGERSFTVPDFTVNCLFGSPPPGIEEGVTVPSLGLTESVDQPHRLTLFLQI